MHEFDFTCFGAFDIAVDGEPIVEMSADKARALLAYLVVESDRAHNRNSLVGLLWPDYPQKDALRSLRNALYRLRQLLDKASADASAQLLTITRQTLQFHPAQATVDVAQFELLLDTVAAHEHDQPECCSNCLAQMAEAVALYKGELLAGMSVADAPAFEEWLLARREHLHLRTLLALQTLTDAHEAMGDNENAYRFATQRLMLDPYQETALQSLMRLAARGGLPDRALAHYYRCRQLLRDELGVEPNAETVALVEQIRRGEFDKVTEWQSGKVAAISVSKHVAETAGNPVTPSSGHPTPTLRDVPQLDAFFGRCNELAQLGKWLVHDRCRLVALLGIGGMGKTSLAAQFVQQEAAHFDTVLWRSLLNAPPPDELLSSLLQTLSNQTLSSLPDSLDGQLQLLLHLLRTRRVLLVLDNLESILHPDQAGLYRVGYEPYGQLITSVATHVHESSLLLTSRERPHGYARLEGDSQLVRTLRLDGLDDDAGHELLAQRSLHGIVDEAHTLIARYSGNPLALKLVADTVDELFAGDIGEFLAGETLVFDDIRTVLDQQFGRLSPLEQEILFWLAVAREPMSLAGIRANLLHAPPQRKLMEALRNLQRRSLIERGDAGFGLQNVITEYLTDQLVETAVQELTSVQLDRLHHQPLLIAQTNDYVRKSQERLILQPIAERFAEQVGQNTRREHLATVVADLQVNARQTRSYAAGNILNLLLHMELDVSGLDLADLSVWQADMQKRSLAGLNLARADLTNCLFRQDFGRIEPVAIGSPPGTDGQVIALGDEYGEIRFYRVSDGQLLLQLKGHTNTVIELEFSVDGRLLASCAHDQTARIWDTASGQLLYTLTEQAGSLYTVAFSSDGRLLASGAENTKIYIWDVKDGRCLLILEKHTKVLTSVLFVPDSYTLLSTGCDGRILAWDLSNVGAEADNASTTEPPILREARNIINRAGTIFASLALSNDQLSIAASTFESTIFVWNYPDGTLRQTLNGHADEAQDLAIWPDDATLISSSSDATIRIWDLQTGHCLDILEGHGSVVKSLSCCPTDRTFISGSEDGTVCVWEMTPQHRGVLTRTIHGNVETLNAIAWGLTAPIVATGNLQGLVRLWDVSQPNPHCLYEFQEMGRITAVAFSPDGQLLATASEAQSNVVHLWDVASKERIGVLAGHDGYTRSVVFSPDGTVLASGANDSRICLWDVTNPKRAMLLQMLDGHNKGINRLAFSPDGRMLVSVGRDQAARIWDLGLGTEMVNLPAHPNNSAVDWHPTASIFAYVAPDDQIIVTDVAYAASEEVIQRFPSHTNIVYALAFSPDGAQLVSVGTDQMMRVWHVSSGDLIHCISVHQNVFSIAYSADGQMIATTGQDGAARLWEVATAQCVQILRPPRLYEGMNITGITSVTEAQKAALKALGAVEGEATR